MIDRRLVSAILVTLLSLAGCSPKSEAPPPAPKPSQPTTPSPAATPTSAAPPPQPAALDGPSWSAEELRYEFGTIWTGKMIIHPFTIKNTGTKTLTLSPPKAYCSCSKATSYPTTIEPGQTGQIQFSLNLTNKAGPVHEYLDSITNDPKRPTLRVEMTGIARTVCEIEVIDDLSFHDGSVPPEKFADIKNSRGDFGRIKPDQSLRRVIRLKNSSGVPINLELKPIMMASVSNESGQGRSVPPMFDAILNPVQEGEIYELTVIGKPPYPPGQNVTALQFSTGLPDYPTYSLGIYGFCPPRFELSPYKIVFNQQATNRRRLISMRNNGTTPFKVTSVECTDPAFKVTLLPTDPNDPTLTQVEVIMPTDPAYIPPTYGETVRIRTTDTERPQIDIMVLPHMTNPPTPRPADKPIQFTPGTMLQ